MSIIDQSLTRFTGSQHAALAATVETLRTLLPMSTEAITWGMPTLKIDGVGVFAIEGFNKHNSLFPMSGSLPAALAADLKGYQYSRDDVDARSLANNYAQILGQIFTHEVKPLEVEILVAEVGAETDGSSDQMFHIMYDGTMVDERSTCVLGGDAEAIGERLAGQFTEHLSLQRAIAIAAAALSGSERSIPATELEVAVLARSNGRRTFLRITDSEVAAAL